MRPYEVRASRILSQVLGGAIEWMDTPSAPSGTHDFDLKLGDGRICAVEVTSSTDPSVVEFWRAVGNQSWPAPRLSRSWVLNVGPSAHVQTLRDQVEGLLEGLEQSGVAQFGPGKLSQSSEIKALHRLGVKGGGSFDETPHHIYVTYAGAGVADIENVRRAVEQEAWKHDNRDKLRRATADERHLFVWIDPSAERPAAAMSFMGIVLPTDCSLPPEIDVLWIATPTRTSNSGGIVGERLWRCDRLSGWHKIDTYSAD